VAILVTGAAGFIGSHLCRRLIARGERVIGVDCLTPFNPIELKRARLAAIAAEPGAGDRFAFHEIDFADAAALAGATAGEGLTRIVHLGAQAGVRYSIENPHAYAHSNLVGHLNILELARSAEVEHLVYASSSSVYGTSPDLPFRVEARVDFPISLYAATKKADELMSEAYAHLYRIPQTGLRFFTVYGPWGRPDMAVWGFTAKILAGEPIEVFNGGRMRRDFTYIDDIIAGVLAVLDHPPADDGMEKAGGSRSPHALYNIGNNRAEELEWLIALIEQACGREAIRIEKPMQPGDVPATYADISAIERDLGYQPTIPIDVGIPRFVEWYRGYVSAGQSPPGNTTRD